jgi:hypothetical protein
MLRGLQTRVQGFRRRAQIINRKREMQRAHTRLEK